MAAPIDRRAPLRLHSDTLPLDESKRLCTIALAAQQARVLTPSDSRLFSQLGVALRPTCQALNALPRMTLDVTAWKFQRHDKPQRGYSGLMDLSTLLSFSLFAFVAAFTPGPNNVMLAASGANFGFRASLPHILGVFTGFTILVVAAGFGLASLFTALPTLYGVLKIISVLFLFYLAWKIASAGRTETRHDDRPLRFWQAAMFQLVNPKGITVIISSVTAYTSSAANLASEVLVILIVLALVTFGSTCTWTLFGVLIGQFLKTETRLRLFNIVMASFLLASLLPVLLG